MFSCPIFSSRCNAITPPGLILHFALTFIFLMTTTTQQILHAVWFFVFWHSLLLCSPGWQWTASLSWMLGEKTRTTTPIISSTFPYAYQLCALSYSLLTILFLACFPHSLKLICIFQRAFVRRFYCGIFAVSDSLLVLFIHSRVWRRTVLDFNKNHFNHHFVVNALIF